MEHHHEHLDDPKEYAKFFGIIGAIAVVAVVLNQQASDASLMNAMRLFMGLFFITLSILKFINFKDFVEAYSRYDIIAKRSLLYARVYPMIELVLGALLLTNTLLIPTLIATSILMLVSSIGVIKALLRSEHQIMCACMGTVIKLPVTRITLIEDIGMGVMAVMLLI